MGLEIQDDELDQLTFQKSEVSSDYHVARADKLRWVRENFVDLGLPSGTLWCKWNLGATNGDTPESWYGDLYQWGDIKPMSKMIWGAYKFYPNSVDTHEKWHKDNEVIFKYNTISDYGEVDGLTQLEPKDDVVNLKLGNGCHIPTPEQIEELCSLPKVWVLQYNDIKGLNGVKFTGNNGNTMFIPSAEMLTTVGGGVFGTESTGYVMSNAINNEHPHWAKCLEIHYQRGEHLTNHYRDHAFSVRGVI